MHTCILTYMNKNEGKNINKPEFTNHLQFINHSNVDKQSTFMLQDNLMLCTY